MKHEVAVYVLTFIITSNYPLGKGAVYNYERFARHWADSSLSIQFHVNAFLFLLYILFYLSPLFFHIIRRLAS